MKKISYGDILKKPKLNFKNNLELEKYYNDKYSKGGYSKGFEMFGINLSNIYHKRRHNLSFQLMNIQNGDKILDAGCGEGLFEKIIHKKCNSIYAVDIAENAFKNKRYTNVKFIKGNIEKLDFSDNFFDKIVCIETLEHVLNPYKVIKEFYRVLKKNGSLVLSYPILNKTQMSIFLNKIRKKRPLEISEHLTEWTYEEVKANFENIGFSFIKSKGVAFDFGPLEKIKEISKSVFNLFTKFQLWISFFPRNSKFVVFKFKK